jgi:hypothetical protein
MAIVSKVARKELTLAKQSNLWTLYCKGYNPSEIFRKTTIPCTTILGFIYRQSYALDTTFESKARSRAKKKLNPRAERRLIRTACNKLRISLKSLSTPSKSGKRLNYYTVAIILKSFGKAKRRLRKKPFLTPLHKQKQRTYCRNEKGIRRDNWKVC